MKKLIYTCAFIAVSTVMNAQTAAETINQAIEALGGTQKFYSKNTVTYDYEYRAPKGPKAITLVGKETYMFKGERSHAAYTTHTLTGLNRKVVEGYNGTNAWVTFDGKISKNEKANGVARFLRKTNYYWFTMFYKLLDPGVNHELLSNQTIGDKEYQRIKITFGDNIGDSQDTYIVYVNKKTQLIEQFLFTVIAFGVTEPYLMTFEYETIDGIKIPSKRKYIESDWEGNIKGKAYYTTNWTNIQFGIELDPSLFEKP